MNLFSADNFPMSVQEDIYHNWNKITHFNYKPKKGKEKKERQKVHEYKKRIKSKALTYMESR